MGYWTRRRDRKFTKLAESSSQLPADMDTVEKMQKAREYAAENRKRDLRKLVPVIAGILIAGFLTRGLLTYLVSGNNVIIFMIVPFIVAFLIMYFITIRTYVPPGIDFTLAGHVEPENIHSMISIADYHVPKELISSINQDALNFPIMRDFGPSNLCDAFDWDPTTGDISVSPAWGANSEYEFVTRHEVFHNIREISKTQARTINNYESYMDLEIEIRSYDKAVEKLDQIAAALFEPSDAKKIMTDLRKQIENDKSDLRVKIYGSDNKKEAPTAPMEGVSSDDQH